MSFRHHFWLTNPDDEVNDTSVDEVVDYFAVFLIFDP